MAISQTQFETELDLAKAALGAGDFAAAQRYVALAELTLAGIAQTASDGNSSATFRQNLDAIRRALDAARDAANEVSGFSIFSRGCVR
jgi:nucleoside-diphosphate-sugar epimerase